MDRLVERAEEPGAALGETGTGDPGSRDGKPTPLPPKVGFWGSSALGTHAHVHEACPLLSATHSGKPGLCTQLGNRLDWLNRTLTQCQGAASNTYAQRRRYP